MMVVLREVRIGIMEINIKREFGHLSCEMEIKR